MQQGFRGFLLAEFERRQRANGRYSLRAFARFLAADHSSLSQMLRGQRPVPGSLIGSFGAKLGLSAEEIAAYRAASQAQDAQTAVRQQQIRHWTTEALSLIQDDAHQRFLGLCHAPDFQPDVRWMAQRLGTGTDQAVLILNRLLRLGLLEMAPAGQWRDTRRLAEASAREFRRAALGLVRELSGVHLPIPGRASTAAAGRANR